MKVGLLSDAHGNHRALRAAIDLLLPTVDRILFAGDSFSDHRFSNETVQALQGVDALCVAGNHELSFLGPAGVRARQAPGISSKNMEFVASLPTRAAIILDGVRITMGHASPWPPYDSYLPENDARWEQIAEMATDVLVTGHTHWPFVRQVGPVRVVNPGSVGRSDCPAIGDDVSWAVLDTSTAGVDFFRHSNPELVP